MDRLHIFCVRRMVRCKKRIKVKKQCYRGERCDAIDPHIGKGTKAAGRPSAGVYALVHEDAGPTENAGAVFKVRVNNPQGTAPAQLGADTCVSYG